MLGIGVGITSTRRTGSPQIITAITTPALGPLEDGDQISTGLSADIATTSNYASTAGDIVSVDLVVTVNGGAATISDTVDYQDLVAITVTVTDDASPANVRVWSLGQTVAGTLPVNTVAPSIAGGTELGDTLTVTPGTWSGVPAPTLTYQWRRDGIAILGETGTTYDIALADSGADIDVVETATNAMGAASEASNAITADTFTVPGPFDVADWGLSNSGGDVSLNIITLPDNGGAALTDIDYRVNGGAAVSLGETTTGSYIITADEGDDIEIRAVNVIGAGAWSDTKVVPAGSQALDDLTDVIITDPQNGDELVYRDGAWRNEQ
jgi:hypothetical protein